MVRVTINIRHGHNKKSSALIKALAMRCSGHLVRESRGNMAGLFGYCVYNFPDDRRANEFRNAVGRHLARFNASVKDG